MSDIHQPCYTEKKLDHCECGRELWEVYRYCDKMALIHRETILPTEREIIIMEHNHEIMQRTKDWPVEIQDLVRKIVYQASKQSA